MARIYCYGDSGPHGEWVQAADNEKSARDGFGESKIYEVPDELWERFVSADEARTAAESDIEQYTQVLDIKGHLATENHSGVKPDLKHSRDGSFVRCVDCRRGWCVQPGSAGLVRETP